MRIRVMLPVLPSGILQEKAASEYRQAAGGTAEISTVCLPNGTATIESDLDIALAQPETVRAAIAAERDGVDACIVACFSDPGVAAAREAVAIPVIGEGQAALQLANLLGGRFSVITTWAQCRPRIRRLVAQAGFTGRLASVRAADVGVLALSNDCLDRVVEEAVWAVRDDGADAVVLGCTGTGQDMAAAVERAVGQAIGARVPIIDPVHAALAVARSCAALGLSHSKIAYPTPASRRPEYRFALV
jgi:allantoin racemase